MLSLAAAAAADACFSPKVCLRGAGFPFDFLHNTKKVSSNRTHPIRRLAFRSPVFSQAREFVRGRVSGAADLARQNLIPLVVPRAFGRLPGLLRVTEA